LPQEESTDRRDLAVEPWVMWPAEPLFYSGPRRYFCFRRQCPARQVCNDLHKLQYPAPCLFLLRKSGRPLITKVIATIKTSAKSNPIFASVVIDETPFSFYSFSAILNFALLERGFSSASGRKAIIGFFVIILYTPAVLFCRKFSFTILSSRL
jgi:hypothetical protein